MYFIEVLFLLGDRLMVGHMPLAHSIGVRVPVPQHPYESYRGLLEVVSSTPLT